METSLRDDPSSRAAQRKLAEEVTRNVHGDAALEQAQSDAALRFGGAVSAEALQQVTPAATISAARIASGLPVTELLVIAGLAKSKSEAFRLVEQGGVAINGAPVTDARAAVSIEQALGNRLKVTKGKRGVAVVEVAR